MGMNGGFVSVDVRDFVAFDFVGYFICVIIVLFLRLVLLWFCWVT